ncbi:hypothetical protein BDZ45DRAFT_50013 [Acephala macrosclerotiorum]|nr:hypothetical protein BDZ45DRAFT_50013 [Acephala macrosclerotiorum]
MAAPYLQPLGSFSEVGLAPTSDLIEPASRPSPEPAQDATKRGHSPTVSVTSTWTSSTPTSAQGSLKEKNGSQSSFGRSRGTSKNTWIPEVICLSIGLAAIGSIIGILAHFNDRTLPSWPYSITLNTIIALLTALANGTLAVPLSNGISQLKWDQFKKKSTPLTDMDLFDQASRGPLGAFNLIARARGRSMGSFGAAITILAFALGPFSQQVATYQNRMIGTDRAAKLPVAVNYTGVLPGDSSSNGFVPILPMKAAVYNGLFAEANPLAPLTVTCETGNCTWPAVNSLAVCSTCIDVTSMMSRYCENGVPANGSYSECGWQLPNGSKLNSSTDVFSMTTMLPSPFGLLPYSTILQLFFMGTEAQSGAPLNYNPWAKQCTLEYCVETIEAAVTDGKLSQNVTATTKNTTTVDVGTTKGNIPVSIRAPNTSSSVFISEAAALGIQSWFATLFTNGSASRNSTVGVTNDQSVVVNLTVGISSGTTYFDSDIVQTFYWDYYEYTDGIGKAMTDLATAMTVAFRSFNGVNQIPGTALGMEVHLHVRWSWIVVPVLVVFSTMLFLALVTFNARRHKVPLWKSNTLAVMFCGVGLDHDARKLFRGKQNLHERVDVAKHVRVRLDEQGNMAAT